MLRIAVPFSLAVAVGSCGPAVSSDGSQAEEFDAAPAPDGGGTEVGEARRVIYQLVVRTFSNTNPSRVESGTLEENGVGKFNEISAEALQSLADMGVTDVWLTGVLRQATLTDHSDIGLPADDPDVVKGRAGSFFAIRDYFDVSPDYAVTRENRLAEFEALVARTHGAGLRVFIDFVPNHVARGYESTVRPELNFGKGDDPSVLFKAENNFYYLPGQGPLLLSRPENWSPAGVVFDGAYPREDATSPERTPKVTGLAHTSTQVPDYEWYETIKLNYGVDLSDDSTHFEPIPPTWEIMDQVLAYWQDKGVDGFRCDFAHVIPHQAWRYLISRARERNSDVYFFGEAYASLEDLTALRKTGFDAIYHDEATDSLKRIYQGTGSQLDFNDVMGQLNDSERPHFLHYLENHDERRIASEVVVSGDPNATGFGGLDATYQLAPLVVLYGKGPVLIYNGQEVGEPGDGIAGFSGADGRSTIFDYWQSPELAKWVNNHSYDGALLSQEQKALRHYYSELLALAQTEIGRSEHYWGLKYYNQPANFPDCPDGLYSFARYQKAAGRLWLVVANFVPNQATTGQLRLPRELIEAAALDQNLTVSVRLRRAGRESSKLVELTAKQLTEQGFELTVPNQTTLVLEIH